MIGQFAKRLKSAVTGGEADADAQPAERVYRVPPLTEEYVAAIRLIAPECDYTPEERYRDEWENIENVACSREFHAIQPILGALPKPRRVLEIGPGLGRSLVYFTRKFGWEGAELHAYEGDGATTKYTKLGPRFEDSFCGSIACLRQTLDHNGLTDVTIHDAHRTKLTALPGPFDVLYSFYSIGFHWAVEHFLDDLLPLLRDDGTAIFTVPPNFVAAPPVAALPHRLIPLNPAARKVKKRNSLLVLRRRPFPPGI